MHSYKSLFPMLSIEHSFSTVDRTMALELILIDSLAYNKILSAAISAPYFTTIESAKSLSDVSCMFDSLGSNILEFRVIALTSITKLFENNTVPRLTILKLELFDTV
jgi:hypothetical protein